MTLKHPVDLPVLQRRILPGRLAMADEHMQETQTTYPRDTQRTDLDLELGVIGQFIVGPQPNQLNPEFNDSLSLCLSALAAAHGACNPASSSMEA